MTVFVGFSQLFCHASFQLRLHPECPISKVDSWQRNCSSFFGSELPRLHSWWSSQRYTLIQQRLRVAIWARMKSARAMPQSGLYLPNRGNHMYSTTCCCTCSCFLVLLLLTARPDDYMSSVLSATATKSPTPEARVCPWHFHIHL